MNRSGVFAALVAAVSFVGVAEAETGRDRVSVQQQTDAVQAKGATKGGGFKTLFATLANGGAPAEPEPVSYTRSWLDQQPNPKGDAHWECLSEALYFEARGETVKGQFAVAEVIMNRVKSSRFPDTPCAVIRQGTGRKYQCQFTYTCDGYDEVIAEPLAYQRAAKVARAIIDGLAGDLTDGATYYHNTSVRPGWARRFTQTARIGVHLFYRQGYRTASND